MNDINILGTSPFFSVMLACKYPPYDVQYRIGEESFTWFYFTADGIYTACKIFAKTMSASSNYSCAIAAVRSSLERVFGILLLQFGIIATPSRLRRSTEMNTALNACVIVHNMVVSERKDFYTTRLLEQSLMTDDPEPQLPEMITLTPIPRKEMTPLEQYIHNNKLAPDIMDESEHYRLQNALTQLYS